MAKIKTRGFFIQRKDCTVPMTKEEQQIAKKLNLEEYHKPKWFKVRVNAAVPPSHSMCEGNSIR